MLKSLVRTAAMAAAITTLMNCSNKPEEGYIGESDIRIEDGKMTPEALLAFGRLSDPQISPDSSTVLYGVSYIDLASNRSCRNLFVTPAEGGEKTQLTFSGKSISNARWSLDGKAIFFIKEGQIWKAPYKAGKLGKAVKISDFPSGVSEFSLSPDQKSILISSTVKNPKLGTPKDSDPALDKAQAYATEDLMYRHWDNWVTEIPQTYVAAFTTKAGSIKEGRNILEGETEVFELPLAPFSGLEQLSWSPDGKYIAYSCKKLSGKQYAFSTNTEIYVYDVESGKTVSKITNGGGYDTDPVFSPEGDRIAWLSMARDGYEADKVRIFVADFADGEATDAAEVTHDFKYNAAGLFWNRGSIYFNALAEGLQAIYKAEESDGGWEISRLTDENQWYDFGSPFAVSQTSEGQTNLIATYSSLLFPTEVVSVKIGQDSTVISPVTKENEHILCQLDQPEVEKRFIKTVDGKDMLTWVMYPPKFDSTKVYPAIEICLGGPQGTLSQDWSYRWNYRLMSQQGYIVAMPNRRGTTAFGQEWTEQISGDYSGLNIQDYLACGREIKAEPYVGKLAACGASYGGYSVYFLAGVHEDLYDCFIAHAGIFDERYLYYETEEMWFCNWDNGGLTEYAYTPGETGPRGDGITYGGIQQAGSPWSTTFKSQRHYANSPSANVTKWHTPILCIHGGMDFRIPYDQGMAAFNCAQMMGVPSKLIVFPEECHWILQPQNALYWHREYFNWLARWTNPE